MTHDELASDLARHLRAGSSRVAWEDLQLGPSGSPRPDVYTMEPTYTRLSFEAFEVKVSKADFRADVTSGKWQSYLKFANTVTFAAPVGIIAKGDVPTACGLILRSETGQWRYAKRATRQVLQDLPWKTWIKLVLDGIDRVSADQRQRRFNEWHSEQKLAKKFGERVGKLLHDIDGLPAHYEYEKAVLDKALETQRGWVEEARRKAEQERAAAREQCSDALLRLAVKLGLPEDQRSVRDVQRQANKILELIDGESRNRWTEHPFLDVAGRMERLACDLRLAGEALTPAAPVAHEDEL